MKEGYERGIRIPAARPIHHAISRVIQRCRAIQPGGFDAGASPAPTWQTEVTEHTAQAALREVTLGHPKVLMLLSPASGQILPMLLRLLGRAQGLPGPANPFD